MLTATGSTSATDPIATAIPLIIGVTGHRDLLPADVPQIRELVRGVFLSLRQKYSETPLVLLSPLVEGADQLVAEVALENGIQLIGVLSWPADFEADKLARGGSPTRFRELLDRSAKVVAMPLTDADRQSAQKDWTTFEEERFASVGKYMARHSQLLIALWDGVESNLSGTARVVAWQQNGSPAPFSAQLGELDSVEGAPICHIITRRSSRPAGADGGKGPVLTYRYPNFEEGSAEEAIHRIWSNIDRFNGDVAKVRRRSPEKIETSRSWVLPPDLVDRLPRSMCELFEYYALADSASLTFQQRMQPVVRSLFVIGPAALICLEVYAHLWSHWAILLAYLVLLAWGYWRFRHSLRADWEGRHLDYRALAEGLRVQFFWRWAGLTDCVADHYLRHLRGELGWIRQASRTCFLLTGDDQSAGFVPGSEESIGLVAKHWLQDQLKYFTKSSPKNERREELCERISRCAFGVALLAAAAELVVHFRTHDPNHELILVAFCGLVFAAVVEEIADYHTYGILARQYEWMKNLFATAKSRLETHLANKNTSQSQRLIHELGLEALNENADWLVQRRRKPMKLPK